LLNLKKMNRKSLILIILILLLSVSAIFFCYKIATRFHKIPDLGIKLPEIDKPFFQKNSEDISKFESKEDFVAYLEKASQKTESFGGMAAGSGAMEEGFAAPSSTALPSGEIQFANPLSAKDTNAAPSRISETNVQVLGIDEPDIVKTDGRNIYFSSEFFPILYDMPMMEKRTSGSPAIYPVPPRPDYEKPKTKIIKAFPVADLGKTGSIDKSGQLLLSADKKTLVVFSGQEIFGYDVSDPKNPKEKWNSKLADKTMLVGSRLHGDLIYLVAQNYVDRHDPCPIRPMTIGSETVSIDCGDIYHPERIIPADVSFSVMVLNPSSGKVEEKTSFVGSAAGSQIYMSEDSIYVTYSFMEDMFGFISEAIAEKGKGILPDYIIEKMSKIKDYDLSDQTKMAEFQKIMEDYTRTLSNDDELKIENEMRNGLGDYFKEHSRELEKTGVVKIDSSDLSVSASGNIPGKLLNQFSLDEYKGNLRVATTVGGNFWGWGFGGSQSSANDIYVLDEDLEISGSIKDLGVTERIYSARFLGNRGYLVTFRQADPFYVLDLADPKNPQMKGELKIPGFSSYLHPIADDVILGVGQESGKVKLSLFDVKNSSDPKEIDKYLLSEYWSEAQNNHHAFLQDSKHEIFFLPGGKGGYVFSYEGNKLSLKKAVSDYQVKRAVYIGDYLYIIGENKISVLDENNWEKVKELDL
jgi:inhibitor of cysteine peptidase